MGKGNLLKNENSPYLLQHADNPVNWHPWGEYAFKKAQQKDKPIFLSIGYSTCHWCHVMARESFEDEKTANLINEVFIPIKVDREERPEIDKIYMNVCQMITGSGGWPLTIFLTPDKEPFFAATYIPRHNRYGRKGLIELVKSTQKLWDEKRSEILSTAGEITRRLQGEDEASTEIFDAEILDKTYDNLLVNYDTQYGGFGNSTKFPVPHKFLFLLHYWSRTEEEKALLMVENSLKNLCRGGIYDQLGYGIHRYAVDKKWLVPHFEKMLYDQALLAYVYTELYQVTGKDVYAQICREILTYVEERLCSPQDVFYAAEDAESEGEEGKYYLWTKGEINEILLDKEKVEFDNIFILNSMRMFTSEDTDKYTLSLQDISSRENRMYSIIRKKLLQHRKKRINPFRDDKILLDWNALMIAALARAAWVFNSDKYLAAAQRIFSFIEKRMSTNTGGLYHSYYQGEVSASANIDDYAFLIWGLIELYEASFNYQYIDKAEELLEFINNNFWDNDNGGYYFSSMEEKDLIIRQKEVYDGAVPSGNSAMFWNLIRLGHITGNVNYMDRGAEIAASFSKKVENYPENFCHFFTAFAAMTDSFVEIVIVGNREDDVTQEMFRVLRETYIPNKVIIFLEQNEDSEQGKIIKDKVRFTEYKMINSKTTAYICKNFSCSPPTNIPEEMLNNIKKI